MPPLSLQEVCHRYWPDGNVQEFGQMEVELLSMKQCDGYTTRTFAVTKVVGNSFLLCLIAAVCPVLNASISPKASKVTLAHNSR